jgi:hypothetical protein
MEKSVTGVNIVFGVLSCRSSSAAISQFADAVYPHKVLVHHDFYQKQYFRVNRENVTVIQTPLRTAWGAWSLVDATLMLIEHALAMEQCDYFQLVSESCLPIRPVAEFSEYLAHAKPDVMIDMQPLTAGSPEAMMNYAWRYLPRQPWLRRVARRSGKWWIGRGYTWQEAYGGNLKIRSATSGTWLDKIKVLVGKNILVSLMSPGIGAFPLGPVKQCWVGSQWFALSKSAAQRILAAKVEAPELEAHFKRCPIPDESYIHTLVAHCAFERIQPSNHLTFWKGAKFGPDEVTESNVPETMRSRKFFARKFSLEPEDPVRRRILSPLTEQRGPESAMDLSGQRSS